MANKILWKGESISFCPGCGRSYPCEAVIRESSKSDETWHLGAPKKVGEYWIILSSDKPLPIRAEVLIAKQQEYLLVEGKEIPLNQMLRKIVYYKTFVLPSIPASLQDKLG